MEPKFNDQTCRGRMWEPSLWSVYVRQHIRTVSTNTFTYIDSEISCCKSKGRRSSKKRTTVAPNSRNLEIPANKNWSRPSSEGEVAWLRQVLAQLSSDTFFLAIVWTPPPFSNMDKYNGPNSKWRLGRTQYRVHRFVHRPSYPSHRGLACPAKECKDNISHIISVDIFKSECLQMFATCFCMCSCSTIQMSE